MARALFAIAENVLARLRKFAIKCRYKVRGFNGPHIREKLRHIAFDEAGRSSRLGQPELHKVIVCSLPVSRARGGWVLLSTLQRNCSSVKAKCRVADFRTMRGLAMPLMVNGMSQHDALPGETARDQILRYQLLRATNLRDRGFGIAA